MNDEHNSPPPNIAAELRPFADAVIDGLSGARKSLPSKYIYNEEGWSLFKQILQQPEYYTGRAEKEILSLHRDAIAELVDGSSVDLVDLGAGDGEKTRVILDDWLQRGFNFRYVPVDLNESAINALINKLHGSLPQLRVEPHVTDYKLGVPRNRAVESGSRFVMFLGASIGNFKQKELRDFMANLRAGLEPGDKVFTGFDLKKNPQKLVRAYNDAAGVTARFNFNLLKRINAEFGGNFELENFQYYTTYNAIAGTVESSIVSLIPQQVNIAALNITVDFDAWEAIHTETARKFTERQIEAMAREFGFKVGGRFYDEARNIVDYVWEV